MALSRRKIHHLIDRSDLLSSPTLGALISAVEDFCKTNNIPDPKSVEVNFTSDDDYYASYPTITFYGYSDETDEAFARREERAVIARAKAAAKRSLRKSI